MPPAVEAAITTELLRKQTAKREPARRRSAGDGKLSVGGRNRLVCQSGHHASAYLMAIGLMGEPTALVMGSGGAQKKNS